MSLIARSWLSFAAIGTGVIHLALVISSPLPIGVVLLVFGLAELAWGVLLLARDGMVLPRLAQSGAVAPLIFWSLLTVAATVLDAPQVSSSLRFVPMGIAAIFELFVAAVLTVHLRRLADPDRQAAPGKPAGAVKYLSAVLVAGILVGGLTTPALAATQAGSVAAEHGGTMGGMMMIDMPGMTH